MLHLLTNQNTMKDLLFALIYAPFLLILAAGWIDKVRSVRLYR